MAEGEVSFTGKAILLFSPAVRNAMEVQEHKLGAFKTAATGILAHLTAFQEAQRQAADALSGILKLLLQPAMMPDPGAGLGNEEFTSRSTILLSRGLDQVALFTKALSEQIGETVVKPLNTWIQQDFQELSKRRKTFLAAEKKHEAATDKYARMSRKKEDEKTRFEANAELFSVRRGWHQNLLEYISCLNITTAKTAHALIGPLSEAMSHVSAFQAGIASAITEDTTAQLATIGRTCADLAVLHQTHAAAAPARITMTLQQCAPHYYPDPDAADPFLSDAHRASPIDTTRAEHEGYLMVRTSAVRHQWRRRYVRVAGGFLIIADSKKETPYMQLRDAKAVATAADDRRNVFTVTAGLGRRSVLLQAESERAMQEWLSVIGNAARELRIAVGRTSVFYSARPPSESDADNTWMRDAKGKLHLALQDDDHTVVSKPVDAMLSPRTARAAFATATSPGPGNTSVNSTASPAAAASAAVATLTLSPSSTTTVAPAPARTSSLVTQPVSPSETSKAAAPATRPTRVVSAFTPTGGAGTRPPSSGAAWSGLSLSALKSALAPASVPPGPAAATAAGGSVSGAAAASAGATGWAAEPARDNPFDELSDLSDDLSDRDDPFL
eukprot:m.125861 g.125861  ORF g.125861 m.125861 type:complete len:614 (-) comp14681_c1_seq1:47-1888(-)